MPYYSLFGEVPVEVPTPAHIRQIFYSCFGETIVEVNTRNTRVGTPSEPCTPVRPPGSDFRHDFEDPVWNFSRLKDQLLNPLDTPSNRDSSFPSSISSPETPPVSLSSGIEQDSGRLQNVRHRAPTPAAKQEFTAEDMESATSSLSSAESVSPGCSPPRWRAFIGATPVDLCSPASQNKPSTNLPPAPNVFAAGNYFHEITDWRLAEVFYKDIWPTDPGLMPPHIVGKVRVPRLNFKEVIILDDDSVALGNIASYFTSALPYDFQFEYQETARRQTGPRRAPYHQDGRHSHPVSAKQLAARLQIAVDEEKEKIHRRQQELEEEIHIGKRGVYGWEESESSDEITGERYFYPVNPKVLTAKLDALLSKEQEGEDTQRKSWANGSERTLFRGNTPLFSEGRVASESSLS
ncbi:hypothetical protein B0T14DRAFT_604172 [Immersiella caudata]|uniref:Uncharacterized protein n=1 Tax=Immersiella caudata TaxID=314043 RepID=A0AA39WS60_9PEZI|nr:hypothetical protein B0T14DRAFT_604172 [Immersiella caudata]